MKFRRRRLSGTLSILLLACGLACSSQEQGEEDGLQVSEQGQQAADNEAAENNGGDDGGNQASNDQAAENNAEEGNGENAGEDSEGEETAAAGNATEGDLQDIIQEMNGQQAAGGQAAAADTPAENPLATSEAVPSAENPAPAADTSIPPSPSPAATTAAAPQAAPSGGATFFQPGGTPAGPGLPEMGSKMAYIVQKGDTLGKISTKIFGSTARWNEIAKLSGMKNPNRIYAGDVIFYTLDESSMGFATAYEKAQRSEEQVQAGDTLATIAQRVYGTTSAWRSIWRQNDRIDNPDKVPPGTTIFYLSDQQLNAALKVTKSKMSAHKGIKTKVQLVKSKKDLNNKSFKGIDGLKTNQFHHIVGKKIQELQIGIQLATSKLINGSSSFNNYAADMA